MLLEQLFLIWVAEYLTCHQCLVAAYDAVTPGISSATVSSSSLVPDFCSAGAIGAGLNRNFSVSGHSNAGIIPITNLVVYA